MTPACFIVFGALRSGSTMLRAMLHAHPGLSCTTEHDFLFDHLRQEGTRLTYDRAALSRDWIFTASGHVLPPDHDGLEALHAMIGQIGNRGGGLPALMVHRNLDKVLACLSDAPIVHFLRDPRDVARSGVGMMWAGNVYYGVDTWMRTEREWDRAARGLGDRVLTIRYEDLVSDPRHVLDRVCRHVGIAYDEAMLSYPEKTTYSAPDASLASQWKRRLSERQIRLIEAKAGPLMAARGYPPSGLPPLVPSPLTRAGLLVQSKVRVWTGMAGVFGVVPMLERGLGRRMNLRDMERRGQAKMDAITLTRLK